MRVVHAVTVLSGLYLMTGAPVPVPLASAAGEFGGTALTDGRCRVPPTLVPRVANSVITTLYGLELGAIRADGSFSLPPSPLDDIELLFVRSPATAEVVLMGYADGARYEIGIEGTALALLLLADPAQAGWPVAAKRDMLDRARRHPDFTALSEAVQGAISSGQMNGGAVPGHDSQLVALLGKIRHAVAIPARAAAL